MNYEFVVLSNAQRLNNLLSRGDKNIKSGGVVRKVKRKLRKAQKEAAHEAN